jgi:small subunit ribosomal protein S5e
MSDGEVEVEAVAGYQVLPKEVTEEIGSIKLFNKWYGTLEGKQDKRKDWTSKADVELYRSYEDVEIRDISLT